MEVDAQREAYGTIALDPTDDVVAGSFGTWRLTYTVGSIGMDDGATLKIATNVSSDWGHPQFDDPRADNYTSVETSGNATVAARWDQQGYERPWRHTITVDVYDGSLGEGDTITLTLGDRSDGSLGLQMQTFPETDFRVIGLVDAFETGEFVQLPDEITFDVVPGPASRLEAVLPSSVAPGEPATLSVRALDRWGNVATGYEGTPTVGIEDDAGVEIPDSVPLRNGIGHADVAFDEGVNRLTVRDDGREMETTTNPAVVGGGDDRIYWGDIHGQSGETVGTGTVREYFEFLSGPAFLDFGSHAGNDFQITDELWAEIQETVKTFDRPGEFVTFLCYEWSANTQNGGDHNVYFRGDEAEIQRSSSWQIAEGIGKNEGTYPAEALYDAFEGRDDVLVVPHQGGRPATLDAIDPDLTPFVEILSVWGVFEWFGHQALDQGYPIGFVAGSDDHTGRPGLSYPTNATGWSFPIKGGLMAAISEDLTREALWEAFTGRRVYATTGARILLDLDVAGAGTGEAVEADGPVEASVRVNGTAPIQRVDLFRGADRVATLDVGTGEERIEVVWTGARSTARHKVLDWSGGLSVDGGRIVDVEGFGFDHPAQGVTRTTGTHVRWNATSAGNYQGVRLNIDADSDATVSVSTPPAQATVEVADLEDPHIIDAGDPDRQLVIRRTDVSTVLDVKTIFTDDPGPGTHPYYVRVHQTDGEMAWSSPAFVTVQ